MQKLLIQLSRRRSLMVPVVTLLAIGIGISGYYIQNRQIVAREEEKQAEQAAAKTPQPVDSTQLSTQETVDETTKVTENGEATDVVTVDLVVENDPGQSEVKLTAKIDTRKAGTCVFYLKQSNYGPEETVPATDGRCEAKLQNPGIDVWEAKVLYTSTDGKTRGDAKQDINL